MLGQREVVAEFSDEDHSAYSANRGPGLSNAQARVEELVAADRTTELWVLHTDRLARGDGRAASHLVQHVLWSWKTGATLRSVEDNDACIDLLYAVVNGLRNHEDSKRKSAATRAGKRRRVERGQTNQTLSFGYRLRDERGNDGRITTTRKPDPRPPTP